MSRTKTTYTSLDESPIGEFISHFEPMLAEFIKKSEREESDEKAKKTLEELLNLLKSSREALTYFENGKEPSVTDLVRVGAKIPSISSSYHHINKHFFENFVTDPNTYKLVIEVIFYLDRLPKDFKEAVTFLDLGKLKVDAGKFVTIELDEENDNRGYYNVTWLGDSYFFNIEKAYNKRLNEIRGKLFNQLEVYHSRFSKDPSKPSEIEEQCLVKEFFKYERKDVNEQFLQANTQAAEYMSCVHEFKQSLDKLNIEEKVKNLNDRIVELQECIQSLRDLLTRNENYLKLEFRNLIELSNHLNFKQRMSNIPKMSVCYSDIFPRKNLLDEGKRNIITEYILKLNTQLKDFTEQLSETCSDWKKKLLVEKQNEDNFYLDQLSSLDLETLSSREIKFDSSNIAQSLLDLESQLKDIDEKLKNAHVYLETAEKIQDQIKQSAKWPELLLRLDDNQSNTSNPLIESDTEARQFVEKIKGAIQTLESRQKDSFIELEKAKAAKTLADAMKSSDPAKIKSLRDEENLKLTSKMKELEDLKQQQEAIQTKLKKINCLESEILESGPNPFEKLKTDYQQIKKDIVKIIGENEDVKNILSGETPTQKAGTEFERLILTRKSQFDASQQLQAEKLEEKDKLKNWIETLQKAKEELNSKDEMPFESLDDKLGERFGIVKVGIFGKFLDEIFNKKEDPKKGFDIFLEKLNDKNHSVEKWAQYREPNKNKGNLSIEKTNLIRCLEREIENCQKRIEEITKSEEVLSKFAHNEKSLKEFSQKICHIVATHNKLEMERKKQLEEKRKFEKEREASKKDLTEKNNSLDEKIDIQKKETEHLKKTIAFLDKMVDLLNNTGRLSQKIAGLKNLETNCTTIELLNDKQKDLFKDINNINSIIRNLDTELSEADKDVEQLADHSDYKTKILEIKNLLNNSRKDVEHIVLRICERRRVDLESQLDDSEVKAVLEQIEGVKKESLPEQLTQLKVLLESSTKLCKKLNDISVKIPFLDKDLENLKKLNSSTEINRDAIDHFNLLNDKSKNLKLTVTEQITCLFNKISKEFEEYQDKEKTIKFTESKKTHEENATKLEQINNYLKLLPIKELKSLQESESLKTEPTDLAADIQKLFEKKDKLEAQVSSKVVINSELGTRINAREDFAKKYKHELEACKANRESQYASKGFFWHRDKEDRGTFIDQVERELDDYVNSGDSRKLASFIFPQKEHFSGFSLRSALNRLLVNLNVLNKQIPDNYNEVSKKPDLSDNYNQLKGEILKNLSKDQPADQMTLLFDEITKLNKFAKTIQEKHPEESRIAIVLATELDKKVTQFIVEYSNKPENGPSEAEFFKGFYYDFICHVHSQDDKMSHLTLWKGIISNIALVALAVLTLGLAVIAKQAITGRFFSKTSGIDFVDSIEKAAQVAILIPDCP